MMQKAQDTEPVVDIHQHHILLVHQLPSIIDALLVLITHQKAAPFDKDHHR